MQRLHRVAVPGGAWAKGVGEERGRLWARREEGQDTLVGLGCVQTGGSEVPLQHGEQPVRGTEGGMMCRAEHVSHPELVAAFADPLCETALPAAGPPRDG